VTEAERVLRNLSEAFNEGDLEGAAGQFADECEWDFPASEVDPDDYRVELIEHSGWSPLVTPSGGRAASSS